MGGLVSSTVLVLICFPAFYLGARGGPHAGAQRSAASTRAAAGGLTGQATSATPRWSDVETVALEHGAHRVGRRDHAEGLDVLVDDLLQLVVGEEVAPARPLEVVPHDIAQRVVVEMWQLGDHRRGGRPLARHAGEAACAAAVQVGALVQLRQDEFALDGPGVVARSDALQFGGRYQYSHTRIETEGYSRVG